MDSFWFQTVLEAIGAAIPLFLAIWWLIRTWRKPNSRKSTRVLVGLLCLFLATLPLNTIGRAVLRTKLAPVQTMVIKQPVPGMRASDVTADYAAEVKAALVKEMNAKVSSLNVKGSSSVLEKDGLRLGVVRLTSGGMTPFVTAFVIRNEQFVRVTCGVPDIRDVDVRAENCTNAMNANLGTSLE